MKLKNPSTRNSIPHHIKKFLKGVSRKPRCVRLWLLSILIIIIIILVVTLIIPPIDITIGGQDLGDYLDNFPSLKRNLISVRSNLLSIRQNLFNDVLMYFDNDLDTIYLDIPFESLHQMEAKRNEALKTGILLSSDDDYVNATLRFEQENPIKINMRLKGDWTDHLKGDKWSYRIHIDQYDGNIYGMRRFSLQAPETRGYDYEWALHQTFQKEGILTTRYNFVNVVINGEYSGIFAIEESFSTELIESQNRREGILLNFDEDMLWENRSNNRFGVGDSHLTLYITTVDTADITMFREGRILGNEVLSQQAQRAVSLLTNYQAGLIEAEDIFDLELWGKYLALVDLFGGSHSTYWINLRMYYNPVTSLLEPMGFDHDAGCIDCPTALNSYRFSLFGNPMVRVAYSRELEKISSDDYLEKLNEELRKDLTIFSQALRMEYGRTYSNRKLLWNYLKEQSGYLRASLNPIRPMYGHYRVVEVDLGKKVLEMSFSNAMVLPLELKEVSVNQQVLDLSKLQSGKSNGSLYDKFHLLNFYQGSGVIQPDEFTIPIDDLVLQPDEDMQVTVVVGVAGVSDGQDYIIELMPQWNNLDVGQLKGLPVQDLSSALSQHPFLMVDEDQKRLFTDTGTWNVSGDLIIPFGYTFEISADTTLLFESDAILYSYETPIHINGTEDFPVILDAQNDSWGGIVVLNAEQTSSWKWAVVSNTASINRDGWMLTGGITFYQSPVRLDSVSISTAFAEDAINVIDSDFHFEKIKIWNTPSDGFDSDFSIGNLIDCEFENIGGDAIDFSGSSVEIRDIFIMNTRDKGISAGEQSNLNVVGFVIQDVQIGVASKDLSSVSLLDGKIINASIASLATYIKKPQYGPAELSIKNGVIENSGIAICQENSSILIEDQPVECDKLTSSQVEMLGLADE